MHLAGHKLVRINMFLLIKEILSDQTVLYIAKLASLRTLYAFLILEAPMSETYPLGNK